MYPRVIVRIHREADGQDRHLAVTVNVTPGPVPGIVHPHAPEREILGGGVTHTHALFYHCRFFLFFFNLLEEWSEEEEKMARAASKCVHCDVIHRRITTVVEEDLMCDLMFLHVNHSGILKLAVVILVFLLVVFMAFQLLEINMDFQIGGVMCE